MPSLHLHAPEVDGYATHREARWVPRWEKWPRWAQTDVVRFTDHEKVGINPTNNYGTPTGVYWYHGHTPCSTFATDRCWKQIGSVEGVTVDLAEIDIVSVRAILDAIPGARSVWVQQNYFIRSFCVDRGLHPEHPGATLWAIGYHWAWSRAFAGKVRTSVWANFWQRAGVDVVVDPGLGIIHGMEKSQVVTWPRAKARVKFISNINVDDERPPIRGWVTPVGDAAWRVQVKVSGHEVVSIDLESVDDGHVSITVEGRRVFLEFEGGKVVSHDGSLRVYPKRERAGKSRGKDLARPSHQRDAITSL